MKMLKDNILISYREEETKQDKKYFIYELRKVVDELEMELEIEYGESE